VTAVAKAGIRTVSFLEPEGLDRGLVGGKGGALAEMARAGLRVPPGFTVTVNACREFLGQPGLIERIDAVLADAGGATPTVDSATEARRLVEVSSVPDDLAAAIEAAYAELAVAVGEDAPAVAVRSSALAEDSAAASFAGEYESYLNMRGGPAVVEAVRRCWASLYNHRALVYQLEHDVDRAANAMAVVVQLMVEPKAAGVMFTLNPLTGDPSRISIEANWGLGVSVVDGSATPDQYLVDRVRMTVIDRHISDKERRCVPAPENGEDGFVASEPVPEELRKQPCLTDEEVLELARIGDRLHTSEGCAQDIEWALDARLPFPENVLLVQRRPETVHSQRRKLAAPAPGGVMNWIASTLTRGKELDRTP
jgi:pyruvate,water dikinase